MKLVSEILNCNIDSNMENIKEIFISHSSKDKEIVDAFVDFLQTAFNINIGKIFCTSTDGTKINSGDDWRNSIKDSLKSAKITFLIITPHYKQSEICLNEMGAAWVTSSKTIPLIVDPIDYKNVGIIQEPLQIAKLLDDGNIDSICTEIQMKNIPDSTIDFGRFNKKKRDFLKRVELHLKTNPFFIQENELKDSNKIEISEQVFKEYSKKLISIEPPINNLIFVVEVIQHLKFIAIQSDKYRADIFEIFCTHIRRRTSYKTATTFIEKQWTELRPEVKLENIPFYDVQLIFNILYGECRDIFIEFRGDFRSLILNNIDFVGLAITNADFSNSFLEHASLYSILEEKKHTYIENCNFNGAFLDAANITNSKIINSTFIKSNMRWTNLYGCQLINTNFSGSNMTGAVLSVVNIKDCKFDYCQLDASELKDLNFQSETNFTNTSFCFASIFSSQMLNKNNIKFFECDFCGAENNEQKYYNGHGRIKRIIVYKKNIELNDKIDLNEKQITLNKNNYHYKKMKYENIINIFHDFCVPNNSSDEKEEIQNFLKKTE